MIRSSFAESEVEEAALACLAATPGAAHPSGLAGAFCAHLDRQGHNTLVRSTCYLTKDSHLVQPYRDMVAPIAGADLRRLVMSNLLREWPPQRGVSELEILSDDKAEFLPFRDCRQLADRLQTPGYEQVRRAVLSLVERNTRRRFPALTRADYASGRGYPARREKFRQTWLSVTRRLLSQLRNARTPGLLQSFLAGSGIALGPDPNWKDLRDSLALALSGIGALGETA